MSLRLTLLSRRGRVNVVRRRPHYVKRTAKRCCRCRKMKSLNEFYRDRRKKDGRLSACKTCFDTRTREAACSRPPPDSKKCSKCKVDKKAGGFYADRTRIDGLSAWCKKCQRVSFEERNRRNPHRIRKQRRAAQRKYKLGVSQRDVDEALEEQNGLCAICRQPPSDSRVERNQATLQADHCHETGKFRGLLCGPCNKGLGQFKDDPSRLQRAAAYLRGGVPSALSS